MSRAVRMMSVYQLKGSDPLLWAPTEQIKSSQSRMLRTRWRLNAKLVAKVAGLNPLFFEQWEARGNNGARVAFEPKISRALAELATTRACEQIYVNRANLTKDQRASLVAALAFQEEDHGPD